ncbi:MAG: hydrogenase-4 component [Streptosporangiaceae bacterium]|nr:hydrogenase-4 component [Streptosporangiaceae bacterium]
MAGPTLTPLLYAPVALPAVVAGLCAVIGYRRATAWAAVVSAFAQLTIGITLAVIVTRSGPVASGDLRADALAACMLLLIGAVTVITTWAGVHHLHEEHAAGHGAASRRYLVLVQLFLGAMAGAVLADNLGMVWVALEGTTIITAFLVGHRRDQAAAEAAWKYVVLCSVGIALAFLATVCLNVASLRAGAHGFDALDWTNLRAHATGLDHGVMRLTGALALLGFGTKAGLAPMHAWLPDAYSQTPAPVSALMSGVLLAVAFTQILRYKAIADLALGPGYMRVLLIVAALISLAVAASLLIGQRDYIRMLAYSSIEHMGLAALGAAAGSRMAIGAVLLHLLGHGLVKAVLLCGAGRILACTGTSRIAGVRALAATRPALAATFGFGLVALLGLPPFSLFASELAIARAGITAGLGWAVAIAFALVLVIFTALTRHGAAMLTGPPDQDAGPVRSAAARPAALAPLIGGLAVCAVLGLALGPLQTLLTAAASIVGAP